MITNTHRFWSTRHMPTTFVTQAKRIQATLRKRGVTMSVEQIIAMAIEVGLPVVKGHVLEKRTRGA